MHPRYLIYLNCIIFFSGLLALYFQWEIQFDLQKFYDLEMIFRLFCMSLFSIVGIWLGSRLASATPRVRIAKIRFPIVSKVVVNNFIVLILLLVAFFVFSLFLSSISLSRSGDGLERVMGGKYLTPLLIFLSAITIKCLDNEKDKLFPLYLLTFILGMYAYGDGTRAAMIGGVTVFMYSLIVDNRKMKIHAAISIAAVFIALIFGRSFVSGVDLNVGFLDYFDLIFDAIFVFWHYFITFSGLHAAYASAEGVGFFGFGEFIYSILPVPASIIPPPSSTELWRVDQFRPLGAQAEMWKVSPATNFIFAFFIGFLLRRTVRKDKSLMLILAGAILYLSFLMSFQYGLRTIQWLIWLAMFIMLMSGFFSERK